VIYFQVILFDPLKFGVHWMMSSAN
jgi:hypothetical protein